MPRGGKRAGAGRKSFIPTDEQREQVELLIGYGLTQDQVAVVVKIPESTLKKYFKPELERGAITANSKVVQSLFKNATQNMNPTCQIWWTKCRMGWKETTVNEHTGKDGGPIETKAENKVPVLDFTGWTPEQIDKFIEATGK